MTRALVQSLWIGPRLSVMEQLAIRSFLDQGHPFRLYAYQPIDGVPEGAEVCSGEEILPASEVFTYQKGCGRGSPSAFSNFFRYKLLLERGGWWADLDAVCLRPLEFDAEHVLGYEREKEGREHLACGLIRAPAGSPMMEYCWEVCRRVDRRHLRWGQIGPALTAEACAATRVDALLLPPEAFYPIDYFRFRQLIEAVELPEGSYSVHLWNSRWRREGLCPDARYAPACLYERLKRRYGVASPPGAVNYASYRVADWWRRSGAAGAVDRLRRLISAASAG